MKIPLAAPLSYSVLVVGIALALISTSETVEAEEELVMPDWVKTVFVFWMDGSISDSELLGTLEYLIGVGIIDADGSDKISELERQVEYLRNQLELETGGSVKDEGDFYLMIGNTSTHSEERDIMAKILEGEIERMNNLIKLPHDIPVEAAHCDEPNAYYYPEDSRIELCYELFSEFVELLSDPEIFTQTDQDTIQSSVESNIITTIYHEAGHAVLDVWSIPFTGMEENVADQFSVYMILLLWEDKHVNDILHDSASSYWASQWYYDDDFSDVHALDPQRFYNLSCYAYGFDPEYNKDLVDLSMDEGGLPEERAEGCEWELLSLIYGMSYLVDPYLYLW